MRCSADRPPQDHGLRLNIAPFQKQNLVPTVIGSRRGESRLPGSATGAGSGAQRAISIGVMGGMGAATVLGVFVVPLFYVVVQSVNGRFRTREGKTPIAQTG